MKPAAATALPAPPLGTLDRGEPIQVFFVPKGTPARPTIARADGIRMWDTAGNCWIDAVSGPVACNLGYGNARVIEAMRRQAEATAFANPPAFESEANRRLADLLAETAGPGLERSYLVSGGSEAIEAAMKFARQWAVVSGQASRWKVISRQPSYHGGTLGALAVSGDGAAEAFWGPMVRPMPKVPAPLSYRMPEGFSAETYAQHAAEALAAKIEEEGPETCLAFLMEPVGGVATGALVATDAYYRRVREICDQYGVLLIYDEVMCGAGRCGTFLSHHRWTDARPDISVLAKGVGAGYLPLGVVLTSAEMQAAVAAAGGFAHGHTAMGNPLACAVGLAVLEETLERGLVGSAARMGAVLRNRLDAIAARSPIIGDVRGAGLLTAVELVADKETKARLPADKAPMQSALRIAHGKGLILYHRAVNGGRYGDWLMVAPPLIVTEPEIDEICGRLEESLDELARQML